MHIKHLLNKGKPTISFELFPPKPGAPLDPVLGAARDLATLSPDFMSVTYGAGGGAKGNTVAIASYIEGELRIPALAHLTCAATDKNELERTFGEMKENHITNILALRGDIPEGVPFPQEGQYTYASELITHLRNRGDFCIGAACYPEGHLESETQQEDIRNLKIKAESGCDFLTTQMFFDNDILYHFLYRIREAGITTPVLAGIMPVTNGTQVKRICQLSGTVLPRRFRNIVDKFGHKPKAMQEAGIAYATEQIIDLLANGIQGVHIYTMNKPAIASGIVQNLSAVLERG